MVCVCVWGAGGVYGVWGTQVAGLWEGGFGEAVGVWVGVGCGGGMVAGGVGFTDLLRSGFVEGRRRLRVKISV